MLKGVERILVTRLRFIGDVVLTTPVVRALRKAYPRAYIAYLAEDPAYQVLLGNPHLDRVFVLRRNAPWRKRLAFYREMREQRFDLVIDLFGNPRSALLAWLTRARYRVGGRFKVRHYFYNIKVDHPLEVQTAIDFHLESLRTIGIEAEDKAPEVFIRGGEREYVRRLIFERLDGPDGPTVGIHPGGTWPAKLWLGEKFAQLADRLIEELGARVIFTQGPGEEGRIGEIVGLMDHKPLVVGPLNLRHLAALIESCDLYISNDCGPMHLSVAVGTPTIGIFGPGQPEIWFPYTLEDRHLAIFKDIPCRPCHRHECDHMTCMKLIEVGDIMEGVRRLIQGYHLARCHAQVVEEDSP